MSKEVKSVEYGLEKNLKAQDFFRLGTDYVEFYVGNANNPHIIIKLLSVISLWRMPD
jgi:hypothetical protein